MKKLPKDAEASNILIGELDELIVRRIILPRQYSIFFLLVASND